jgi:anti-sigma-K factor RskA
MTHEQIYTDLSSYALDALDAHEREEITTHLAGGCVGCERELESWRELVGVIALGGQDAPPPNLKPALFERVRASGAGARPPATVVPLRRWPVVALALAATALLSIGIARDVEWRGTLNEQQRMVAQLRGDLTAAHGNLDRVAQQLAAQEKDLTSLRAVLAAAQESLAIVQAPGLRLVRLKEAPQAQPGDGHVLISASGRALFYAFDLKPLPPEKAYELWWITEKEGPINAGVFRPDERGLGRIEAAVPTDAGAVQAAAVTIEPAAGVPKPTGPMILLGNI